MKRGKWNTCIYWFTINTISVLMIGRAIFKWFFLPQSGPWSLIQFHNHFSQTVGLLGRVISLS
jgi:hypothetical protein